MTLQKVLKTPVSINDLRIETLGAYQNQAVLPVEKKQTELPMVAGLVETRMLIDYLLLPIE